MFEGLDSSIKQCEFDNMNATNEWGDVVLDSALSFINSFEDNDWEKLFKVLPYKSIIWQKRLCDCLGRPTSPNKLRALLYMSNTNDLGLFSLVISRLVNYEVSDIDNFDALYEKVEQNINNVQGYYQEKFSEFLEKKNRVR